MTLLSSATVPALVGEPPYVWDRQTRSAVEAVVAPGDGSARVLLVGNAGSGKSTTLRHLHHLLIDRKRDAMLVSGDSMSLGRVPNSHVLLVDDLHLMSPKQVEFVKQLLRATT